MVARAQATPPFVEHCLELLSTLGPMRARRMFGGHGLYAGDLFVAIIAGDMLYLKADASTVPRFVQAGCAPFVYESAGRRVALGYYGAPGEAMDAPSLMAPWARLAMQAALAARAVKPPKAVKAVKAAKANKASKALTASKANLPSQPKALPTVPKKRGMLR